MFKNKGFSEIILLLIIAALIGVSGYFFYQNSQLKDQYSNQEVESDMKSFSNDIYSFRYPSEYTIEERENGGFVVLLEDPGNPVSVALSIDSRLLDFNSSYSQAVEHAESQLVNISKRETELGIVYSGQLGPGFGEGTDTTRALIEYKDGAISISTSNSMDLLNQVVDSFELK